MELVFYEYSLLVSVLLGIRSVLLSLAYLSNIARCLTPHWRWLAIGAGDVMSLAACTPLAL